MRRAKSLGANYFEALYRDDPDPWRFATSPYERAKYQATLAALGDEPVGRVLELGCAIGVLTQRLAARCGQVVAVDISATALEAARARCAGLANVELLQMALPAERPPGDFDLILLSEVVYYWDEVDVARMGRALGEMTAADARVLLVHWTGQTDYPKSADAAVEALARAAGPMFAVETTTRTEALTAALWPSGCHYRPLCRRHSSRRQTPFSGCTPNAFFGYRIAPADQGPADQGMWQENGRPRSVFRHDSQWARFVGTLAPKPELSARRVGPH